MSIFGKKPPEGEVLNQQAAPGLKDVPSSVEPWSAGVADEAKKGEQLVADTQKLYDDAAKKKAGAA